MIPKLTYILIMSLIVFGIFTIALKQQPNEIYQTTLKERVGDLTLYFKYKNKELYQQLYDSVSFDYDTLDIMNILSLSNEFSMDPAAIAAIRDHAFMQGIDSVDIYTYYLISTANAMNVKVTDIDYVLLKESSRDKGAINPKNGASGLNQWTRTTAPDFGVTVEQIRLMGYKQQFELLIKYWQTVSKRHNTTLGNVADLYLATFQPKWLVLDGDAALSQDAYNLNYELDTNLDGKLTKTEFLARLKRGYEKYLNDLKLEYKSNKKLNFIKS